MKAQLEVKNVSVRVKGKIVVRNISFVVPSGEIHVLMGPNGSGKTSLCFGLMGHPQYKIVEGSVLLNGQSIEHAEPNERAKLGLFLSFQHPPAFEGMTVAHFLRSASNALHETKLRPIEFRPLLEKKMKVLNIDPSFRDRSLNQGFSGGERKRMEMLQLALLEPSYAMLDETDSGLDIDALKMIAKGLKEVQKHHALGALIISHNPRLFDLIKPHRVHIMLNGRMVRSGGIDLLEKIKHQGYDVFKT